MIKEWYIYYCQFLSYLPTAQKKKMYKWNIKKILQKFNHYFLVVYFTPYI